MLRLLGVDLFLGHTQGASLGSLTAGSALAPLAPRHSAGPLPRTRISPADTRRGSPAVSLAVDGRGQGTFALRSCYIVLGFALLPSLVCASLPVGGDWA